MNDPFKDTRDPLVKAMERADEAENARLREATMDYDPPPIHPDLHPHRAPTPTQSDEERAHRLIRLFERGSDIDDWETPVLEALAQARAEEREAIERDLELIAVDWRDGGQEQKWYAWEYLRAAIRAHAEHERTS